MPSAAAEDERNLGQRINERTFVTDRVTEMVPVKVFRRRSMI